MSEMENLGRSREPSRKIVAPAVARLAGAASRPNAPGGGPLGKRVRERVVSGFQDARRRLVERDRGGRRRPVICGRRRVSPKRAAEQALRRRSGGSEPPSGVGADFLTGYPYGILFVSPPNKNSAGPSNERRERFPKISGSPGPGRPAGGGAVKLMLQVPFRTRRRSMRHFPVARSRRDPASGPLARVRDLAATLIQFGGDATHPASSARVSCRTREDGPLRRNGN